LLPGCGRLVGSSELAVKINADKNTPLRGLDVTLDAMLYPLAVDGNPDVNGDLARAGLF
jgi:hypothetical protein